DHSGGTGDLLAGHRRLIDDGGRYPGAVVDGVAPVRDEPPDALEPVLQIELVGVADSAVDLDGGAGRLLAGLRRVDLGGRDVTRGGGRALSEGVGGAIDERTGELDGQHQIGQLMLERLERADLA